MSNKEKKNQSYVVKLSQIETPIGAMNVIVDNDFLYLLDFLDSRNAESKISKLCQNLGCSVEDGVAPITKLIDEELRLYFQGKLKKFETPLYLSGSKFQKSVWGELIRIPYGKMVSYSEQAKNIDREKSFRAVANANGANRLSIIIPCHRVVRNDGNLGGYGGGIDRKKWLLDHEFSN